MYSIYSVIVVYIFSQRRVLRLCYIILMNCYHEIIIIYFDHYVASKEEHVDYYSLIRVQSPYVALVFIF